MASASSFIAAAILWPPLMLPSRIARRKLPKSPLIKPRDSCINAWRVLSVSAAEKIKNCSTPPTLSPLIVSPSGRKVCRSRQGPKASYIGPQSIAALFSWLSLLLPLSCPLSLSGCLPVLKTTLGLFVCLRRKCCKSLSNRYKAVPLLGPRFIMPRVSAGRALTPQAPAFLGRGFTIEQVFRTSVRVARSRVYAYARMTRA